MARIVRNHAKARRHPWAGIPRHRCNWCASCTLLRAVLGVAIGDSAARGDKAVGGRTGRTWLVTNVVMPCSVTIPVCSSANFDQCGLDAFSLICGEPGRRLRKRRFRSFHVRMPGARERWLFDFECRLVSCSGAVRGFRARRGTRPPRTPLRSCRDPESLADTHLIPRVASQRWAGWSRQSTRALLG